MLQGKMQSSEDRMTKTTDFLRKAEHLRKLADKHGKERTLYNHKRKNCLAGCGCILDELENKLNSDRKAEQMRVQQQLQKIRNAVYRFQGQLIDVKPSPDLIEKLKDIMSEIECSVNTFKEEQHQSFEELLKEERTSWQEICALERKIHAWSLIVKKDSEVSKVRPSMEQKGREQLPLEVTALENFLQQTGGKLGGWDQYDHQSFLKVWTKHSGKPSYRTEVKFYLPDKTEQEIRLHEDWYVELCCLQEKKKEAIQRWRAERQSARLALLQSGDQEVEVERKEREAVATDARRLQQQERRKEVASHLEAWRNLRREQREQEAERRLREEVLQRKRLKEERRRQLEVKLAVEAHLRQKKEEEELLLLEMEAQERMDVAERQRLAAKGIRRFQERDLRKLEIKQQDKQTKEEAELERQQKLAKLKEKVESQVNRDPSRLWKPTKGWQERTKEIGPTGSGPVYQMFHRAVPTWRQGL
ncbi:coiled-coil domain-containing protein 112 [Brachyhypopomus gauderio]|uniref:coiled-coil domain-containing protein 112 n=1 Tax=Brachyhypopomus gauderio TaxID=698409 RepID=UPI0040411DA9